MTFSVLSWNLRQYRRNAGRLEQAVNTIAGFDPEPHLFGLIEFEAKNDVRSLMFDYLPQYDFGMTDSRQGMELLVGWRRGFFEQVIYTQRRRFQRSDFLRPGGLVSARHNGDWYNSLFLHMDSGAAIDDFQNRQQTFQRVWNLDAALRRIPEMQGDANLVVLGDLNTMGDGAGTSGDDEVQWLINEAPNHSMRVLAKESDETWHQWGRGGFNNRRRLRLQDLPTAMKSNLDHVIASNELQFNDLALTPNNTAAQVFVSGWQELQGQERIDYLWNISDHCALYVEVL